MREDVYEPLTRYRDEFKEKFARLTAEKFEELLKKSGVDEQANRVLVAAIRKLEKIKAQMEKSKVLWNLLCTLLVLAALAGAGAVLFALFTENPEYEAEKIALISGGAAVCAVSLLLVFKWCLPVIKRFEDKIRKQAARISQKKQEAWEQLAPLNELFDWSITAQLIEQTVPRIQLDPFFTEARLQDLEQSFGWDGSFNEHRSVIHAHSGMLNSNPFVLAELRRQEWTSKIYTGHLQISWTETVRDSNGNTRRVRRYETLTATVEKPVPIYLNDKVLIFGNEAAPDLDFSRHPSDLSGADSGLWNSIKRSGRLNKLKKLARNLDDDSDFTMMSNEEFELLFHATDRNHEVQFRLLFTPLAQQQMVELLNDKTIGFGDDFHFIKDNMINIIIARHFDDVSFSHDPAQFRGYEVEHMRRYFRQYNETFFKTLYFALAPLLIVPLYQQTRTRQAIWQQGTENNSSCWEHEAIANFYGDDKFNHPDCITQSILKTRSTPPDQNGERQVEVTAYGFRGETRVDFVSVFGGDGRFHSVPVEWVEYLPVEHTSGIVVQDSPRPETADPEKPDALFRRSIYSYINR